MYVDASGAQLQLDNPHLAQAQRGHAHGFRLHAMHADLQSRYSACHTIGDRPSKKEQQKFQQCCIPVDCILPYLITVSSRITTVSNAVFHKGM
jgi:hypothetical protein